MFKDNEDYDLFSHISEQLGMENVDDKWLSKKDGDIKRLEKNYFVLGNILKVEQIGLFLIVLEKTRKGQPVFPTYKFTHEQFARILNIIVKYND